MNEPSSELERIADQLERSVRGGAWHGPSVREVLVGVEADQAASRVLPECHSAWELVLHITAWTRATSAALRGSPLGLSDHKDWPAVSQTSTAAWEQAQNSFFEETDLLLAELKHGSDQLLREEVPGRDYDFYHLLHGLVQHNLYHAGQIRLLTK